MTRTPTRRAVLGAGAAADAALATPGLLRAQSRGVEISVTRWGALRVGPPYAAAMARGRCRQAGLTVTGSRTS
ncbi:MAG: ABC transporter substrate-binding protein, partial [Tagaea sp.]